MTIHLLERTERRTGSLFLFLALTLALSLAAEAQTASTVREEEFRSRWADYQVDLPAGTAGLPPTGAGSPGGLLGVLTGKSIDQVFSGALQVRLNLATGWEYSDETALRPLEKNRSFDSPFASPAIGLFYNREFGPLTLSARYSAGYTYYLDNHYVGSSENGGIFSETGGVDLDLLGTRNTFRSTTESSYGNGNDIESGQQRNRFAIGEAFTETYQLTEFIVLAGSGTVNDTIYSGGTVAETHTLEDAGRVYAEYSLTGKTRLRLELGAGQQRQTNSDRSYEQALGAVNWTPTPKLTIDVGLGVGDQQDSGVIGTNRDGVHPVYNLTIAYALTEKTSGSFHVGYQGVDVEPDVSLQVQWQPRETTTFRLSVYQTSNLSTFLESQNLVTRGILGTGQQRLFQRADLQISGGVEQSLGYSSLSRNVAASSERPYYFGNLSLLWQINSWLAFQTYYRGYTGRPGVISRANEGLQSRVSASLRITF